MEIEHKKKDEGKNNEKSVNINKKNFNDNILLDIEKMINIINILYKKNNNYNDMIEHNKFINKISQNIDNYYNRFNKNNNLCSFCLNDHNENFFNKTNKKFRLNINFMIKKLLTTDKKGKKYLGLKIKLSDKTNIYFLINSLFILKNLINDNNHICLKNLLLFFIFLKYSGIISLNFYKFIIEFYINIFINLIVQKIKYIEFIDDLIEAIIRFPFKIKIDGDDNILIQIITLFEQYFINDIEIKMKINNSLIWQKLLGNKLMENLSYDQIDTNEKNNYLNKLFLFLVNIYKYNLSINLLFDHIYKYSVLDLNYYLNSIKFLSLLFKEEDKIKKDYSNFNIKNGFYISENNPLILEKIKFKENEFCLIFSFRIIWSEEGKEMIIFNLSSIFNNNIIFKFIITEERKIKIIHGNKEWKINEIKIMNNKDYLVCLSQSYSKLKSTELLFSINNINDNKKKISKLANKNVIINANNIKTKKHTIKFNTFEIKSSYPYFDSEMILELGKSNFNGIIGDFIIINKKLKEADLFNLFNLNGYYFLLAENINNKYNLINKFDNFYEDNKEFLLFFKKLNSYCILKILSNKLNHKFIKDKKELLIENYGTLKHKNNQKIKVINFHYSIDFFYNKNGIEFLSFQLYNIANIINKNENEDLFNIYLYYTLNLFYDIMIDIDDDNTGKKKNDSLKFSYFVLSLMIILYKKKKHNIHLDNKIYELLLKYIDFYKVYNYYTHRSIIFSLLLDDSLFNQCKILKDGKIFVYLMDIIKNNINNDKAIINEEILLKILNLDFILESKEYHHHKLYMKLILSLLLIKDNKIIYENIIKNIITIKNEVKLYHYLKYLYLNYESLKELLEKDRKFHSYIKKYLQKETNHCHCKYCWNIFFLIFQIKESLQLEDKEEKENEKNKKKSFDLNNSIKDKEFIVKYKIYLIKCKFINCLNINNEIKFKFIKYNKCLLSNEKINLNKKFNEKEIKNKNNIINIDLLQFIRTSKIIYNFDSIVNDINSIYDIYLENQKKLLTENDINKEEKELIYNVFEIFKFFWEELINYFRRGKYINSEHLDFLNMLLNLGGTETFFRIYLLIDSDSAITILHQIIMLSIKKIKRPFYYNYIEIEKNIDKYNRINNQKLKNKITEKIILEIDKINDNEETSIQNIKYLLIIINEIVQNSREMYSEIEKYFIMFLRGLSDKKFFSNKILYKHKSEYFNLLELSLNILFGIKKINNYNNKYDDFINQFVILENNKSIFYLIDIETIQGKKINIIHNKKKEKDISNILYCLYFLIYFIDIKLEMEYNIETEEKENSNNNVYNPICFIMNIINIIFNNSKDIFKLVNKKNLKTKKLKKFSLEAYINIFNFYATKIKGPFSFEEFEKHYKQINYSNLKSKKQHFKDFNKSLNNSKNLKLNKNKSETFTVKHFDENSQTKEKKSDIIIDNYIHDDMKIKLDKINQKNMNNNSNHNSINAFSRKIYLEANNNKEKVSEEKIKTISYNKNSNKEEKGNSKTIEAPCNEIKNIESESSSDDSSSSDDDPNVKENDIINKINNSKDNDENNELETIKISEITSSKEKDQINTAIPTLINSSSNSTLSKTNSIAEDETNNNSMISGINNSNQKEMFCLKKLIEDINIPIFYYKQLINYNQLYFTKILANPKVNFLWKIFTYSFRDFIFNDKNFIKVSKCFKIFSKNYILEMSSKEENKYHLNYPTKIKNFICNDYYRPFLKPDMKFFNRSLIKTSHNYIPNKIIEKIKLENKLSDIKFIKFFPINEKEKDLQKFYCENVSYKGSIFGKMYVLDSFFVFVNKDYKNIKKNREELMFFLYSKEDITKYKNIKKVIIFYYNEIKEIIVRRFWLKYIGYEIFLKDGRSYLFNFFKADKLNDFSNLIQLKNKEIIINDPINYFDKKDYKNKYKKGEINNFQYLLLINKFSTRTYNNNSQYLVFPIIYMNLKKNILRDLSKAVCLNKEDPEDLIKYKMNYDLLKCHFNTHYSTSAYVLYYLVRLIPYTYLLIDFQSGKFDVPERIFSNYNNYYAALLTSSENRELIPEFFHNYEFCINLNYNNIGKLHNTNILINNFNTNKYKNAVEFIINHRKFLDNNANIVPWINNVFGSNQINGSKELMNIFPLYTYEQFNDFDKEINSLKENLKDKDNYYIEIYDKVRSKLAILDLGISPVQIFKAVHPENPTINLNNSMIDLNSSLKSNSKNSSILNNSNSSFNDDNSSKNKSDKKTEKKDNEKKVNDLFITIKNYISSIKSHKYQMELNNHSTSLFFIFQNEIVIYNILNNFKKYKQGNEPQLNYPLKLKLSNNLIQIESEYSSFSKNICCELMQGFYCICRNDNNTLKFINYNEKYNFSYLWICIITAVEPYNKKVIHSNYFSDYKWKLYFGDEEGNLNILDYNFKYTFKNNEIRATDIKVTKKIKAHKNYVVNISYNERLNIVISSSGNGDISINNAYSLETLNFIKIGTNYFIYNIKISFYDLLYVNCYNYNNKNYYLKCFTLNGIKVSKIKTEKKIINFFISDYVNIYYEDRIYDKCCLYDFKEKKSFNSHKKNKDNIKSINICENEIPIKEDYYSDEENEKNKENLIDNRNNKLVHCYYCNKIKKLINIYDNNEMSLENL